jgi:predicted DCC family thiol-disulfide oxidoreductase YuxK
MLTIFYDGNCPMCAKEMGHLKKHDADNLISWLIYTKMILNQNILQLNLPTQ